MNYTVNYSSATDLQMTAQMDNVIKITLISSFLIKYSTFQSSLHSVVLTRLSRARYRLTFKIAEALEIVPTTLCYSAN